LLNAAVIFGPSFTYKGQQMLKKLIFFAITSGLAAKWYKSYANKSSRKSTDRSSDVVDVESRRPSAT
jgi:hypothetical protein